MLLDNEVKKRLANATADHSGIYVAMKASEELLELSEELLNYLKFCTLALGRKRQVHDVCVEIADAMLVLVALEMKCLQTEKDVPAKARMELDAELHMSGLWENAANTMNTVNLLVGTAKKLVQLQTKQRSVKDSPWDDILQVKCHIYRLCKLFAFSDTQMAIIQNEKLAKLEKYNREIVNFGKI
jgi:hypothetical protein